MLELRAVRNITNTIRVLVIRKFSISPNSVEFFFFSIKNGNLSHQKLFEVFLKFWLVKM